MLKKDVREKAEEYNLVTAHKKDSTGVCFIGERDFKEFLKNYIPSLPGDIIDTSGNIIGKHEGTMYYTIGQRHGLGIGGDGEPWFVCGKDMEKRIVYACQGRNNPLLYSNKIILSNINFFNEPPIEGSHITAKFRYRSKDDEVIIHYIDDGMMVEVPNKAWAVTPGQACVFYDGEYCLGGGIIEKAYMDDEERHY